MKRKLNRLLALLLCALMISSELTGLITPAQAAPAATATAPQGEDKEFRDSVNGRPNLFVDFLGDNANYIYTADGAHAGRNGAGGALASRDDTSLDTVSIPAPYDQSAHSNPTGPGNKWARYLVVDSDRQNAPGTVFWVGVGVDRTQLLQLLKSGEGLTSLEAGFYYDNAVIEPYVDLTLDADPAEAYRKTIEKANINNPYYPANTQWSGDYTILRAERELDPPKTDAVTREELTTPTISDILDNTLTSNAGRSDWKMTYVSLELKDITDTSAARRLGGNIYTGVDGLPKDSEGTPITPASASGDQYVEMGDAASGYDYNYLLLIPFKLKAYGTERWTPLRLVRDATHFSIGASTWGVDAYGAWERSTKRNPEVAAVAGSATTLGVEGHPERDLKLLTRFAGDLNLFGMGRVEELEYEALLKIISGGGSLNSAKLTVDGDPAVWPVWADTDGDVIGGLQSGLGMRLDVHAQDGYEATVTVTYEQVGADGSAEMIYHQYTQILDGANDDAYTFVMPAFVPVDARRVTVTVTFQYKSGDRFRIYLSELPQPGDTGHAVGNETTIRTNLDSTYANTANTNTINSYDSMVAHPNSSHAGVLHPATTPVGYANKNEYVQITVETHADYEAVVRIYDFDQSQFIASGLTANATGIGGVTPDSTMIPNPAPGAGTGGIPATIPGPHYGEIVLPNGGFVRLTMGITDLDVEVTYRKGARHEATLEVDNIDPAADNFDLNTAQLVYDQYDALNAPSKAYSSVIYNDYDKDAGGAVVTDNERAIKANGKLPWISESQASLSGSLGGDTGRVGKTWNPKDLPVSEDPVTGGNTVMALLAGSSTKAGFRAGVTGLDFATTVVDDGSPTGLTGLRKTTTGELYGDTDVASTTGTTLEPSVVDVLWEMKTRIDADTATGGLRDTYLKTVPKSASDPTAAYTYYDLTSAQLQAYLLEVFEAQELERSNDLAYRIARQRYLTVLDAYNQVKDIPAYGGMDEPKAPAKNYATVVNGGVRSYQGANYADVYLANYNDYLDDYEQYLDALNAAAGTGTGITGPITYPGGVAPAVKTVPLLSHTDAVNKLKTYAWVNTPVPTDVPNGDLGGTTIETREGRTVWVVLEADSAYEVRSVDVYQRGSAPGYATGALLSTPASVRPSRVPGYQNVYAFTMPDQDCVVRVTYQPRETRKLNIAIHGAAGQADNLAVIEAYSVADPAAVTPQLNTITNKGYTGTPLPSGGSYDAANDIYTPDPVEKALTGSTVTARLKAAKGYVIKSVEARNSDSTSITVTSRVADDPKDGMVYTFVIPQGRTDDVELVITYAPEDETRNTATIRGITEGATDGRNQATWYVVNGTTVTTPTVINDVAQGTHLTGHISVAPGYYIKSVTASGPSGNYSYTLDGNGYNAGYGTWVTGTNVPLNLYVDMPGEDLVVDVVFAKGPPEPAPINTLTLIVKDDENDEADPSKAAPNWAKASVYDTQPTDPSDPAEQYLPSLGALPGDVVGKNDKKGNGTLTDRKYVDAGKWVQVDFGAHVVMIADPSDPSKQIVDVEHSYYVSSVTAAPSNLGIPLRWTGPTSAGFYMPAGSTSVTVEFSKYPANGRLPDYVLTVRETYTDLNPGATPPGNTNQYSFVTTAQSGTIDRWSPGGRQLDWNVNPEKVPPDSMTGGGTATGAATAGEKVTMLFDVDEGDGTAANPGWYYQSVVLISNGAAIRLSGAGNVTLVKTTGTVKTYQVAFNMPTGPAEFVVNYRKGPKPDVPDYAFSLILEDPDNVLDSASGKWDENNVSATFEDPTGALGVHDPLKVGHNLASMTAIQHIHAGDIVTLDTTVAAGYHMEYMIINPARLHITPVWTDPDTATFVMPSEGVAVVARVVKGEAKKYTANLILRFDGPMPAGVTMDQIGQGTFVLPDGSGGTLGSRDSYPTQAIFSTTQVPGTGIDYDLYAFDGYYIDRVTVDPAILGVTGSLSGSCGQQGGDFVMPAADVNVNVWFKKGWPDEIPYDLTIKVHDSSVDPDQTPNPNDNNYAALRTVTGRVNIPAVAAGDKTPVYGGQVKVIDSDDYPLDRDVVIIDVKAQPGFYVDSGSIRITDTQGNSVAWWYVPGGIAFTQPPRAVTAEVTFKRGAPAQTHTATLHLTDAHQGDTSANSAIINDSATMSTTVANATPASVNTDGAVITNLYHGDALDLSVLPGAGRHVSAVYAVASNGDMIPIYGYDVSNALTGGLAQFVPGQPGSVTPAVIAGAAVVGAFAMPESDVDVYVKFDDGVVDPNDVAVKLVVSGEAPSDLGKSGSASAHIQDPRVTTDMNVPAPGMDSRFTSPGNQVTATFKPKTADGYDIVKLEVTSNVTGASVPYEWISMLQDPPTDQLTNTGTWSGNAPAPGITHPGWKPNPEKQIKLTVPAGGVTIHVTYGKVTTDPFRVQVVVNDPLAGDPNSRNNAWVRTAANDVQRKLQTAKPGDWIDLDITVHPGYRIEFVKVIPQSFGIVPGLPVGTAMPDGSVYYLHDQTTGFTMPNGDCTVYVKFVTDGIDVKNATLVVNGAPQNNNANNATIQSPQSGLKGPVYVNGATQSVAARPGVDWITSDYYWDTATSSVASITVKTISGANVPFTQAEDPLTGHGQITFPMSREDVIVTITYQNSPDPVGQEIVLHVIDKDRRSDPSKSAIEGDPNLDGALENYGRLIYGGNSAINAGADDTGEIAPNAPENTATIHVPAGQSVQVIACSDDSAMGLDGNGKVYIESAYVLFEQNGQMVHFNLDPDSLTTPTAGPGYSGFHDESSFVVHPGRNDVYVTLTRVQPKTTEHAAVLMIRSPAADTSSEAGIHADQNVVSWNSADPARRDKVRVNDPTDSHAYVTATDGEKITVNVEPASGYVIDYIQVTPLGFPLDTDPAYSFTVTGNTFTFDMPHCNVAVTVYLKRGDDQDFDATLHFIQDPACLSVRAPQAADYAKLSWTPSGELTRSIWADENPGAAPGGTTGADAKDWGNIEKIKIRSGSQVTLDVTLDTDPVSGDSDVILSAFVIRDGAIVQLTPTFPAGRTLSDGLEGLTESASAGNNALSDATATFTMPMGDVDVYVVVTTDPPPTPWHTAVLVATDHSPTGNNSGLNEGDLWNATTSGPKQVAKSDNVPTIAWLAVPEGESFSVQPRAAAGYTFTPPAVLTCNDGIHNKNMTTSYINPYIYTEPIGTCNKVVRIDFESNDDLELTVEIEDPDNPGDGTVEQVVTVDPAGTTPPTLRLTSTSVAGSYQIISGITAGGQVELDVTPHPGYQAYAQLFTHDGTVTNLTLTDADGDGVWEGSFAMPPNNARVVITFYEGYVGTLTLINRISGDFTGQATMRENKRGLAPITVSSLTTSDSFTSLPNGTKLDAQITSSMAGRTATGLLTVNGSTTLMTPEPGDAVGDPEHYRHTIDRADAEITLVLDSPTEHPDTYIAAVTTVNKPGSATQPTIADTTTAGQLTGNIWTTAVKDDTVSVGVSIPYGYEVTLSAVSDTGAAVTLDHTAFTGPAAPGTPDTQTATFTMPQANVQVTVTYKKVIFDLTLRVVDTSGVAGNATALTATSQVVSGGPTLTADGQSMTVRQGGSIDLSATPATGAVSPAVDPRVVGIYYQSVGGAAVWLQPTALGAGAAYSQTGAFTMPGADTTVTVIYDKTYVTEPDDSYYIATVQVVDPDSRPGNRAVSLHNTTTATLPSDSPNWAAGYPADGMSVSYEAEQGYYATVTAKRLDTGAAIPVLQMGSPTNGTASVSMPAANVLITITYSTVPPDTRADVALQLIKHGAEPDNKATTTDFTDTSRLPGLATNGASPLAPHVPAYTDPTDPVETMKSYAVVGDDLRTLANWANNYQVVRMTVAVRKVTRDGSGAVIQVDETPEVELLTSKYGAAATSRAPMPPTGVDEEAVIRVYYGNIYSATFHLVGDDPTDTHSAIDVDNTTGNTLNYTSALDSGNNPIGKPIVNDLDRFEGYQGNKREDIRTTAVAGTGRRLVDVVWESDLTGAASATLVAGTDRYDFTMPAADVDFYAFFEKDDPDNRSYVAKVAFAPDSAHQGSSQNAVSIANTTDTAAPKGKYWVGAKGGDDVEVTVKVAPGYQAEIITTKIDDSAQLGKLPQINDNGTLRAPTAADDYQYYITRTTFVPNLTAGKTASFTMPLDTDATVTVRYTKGYDLELVVKDTSGKADDTLTPALVNRAKVTTGETPARTLEGVSTKKDGTGISYTPSPAILKAMNGGVGVQTDVTAATTDTLYRVFRATPFTGTVRVDVGTATNPYSYTMPSEDTVETVLFYNDDAPLLAKVELKGDSDVNGNTATPIIDHTDRNVNTEDTDADGTPDAPANKTTTGTVWTTTAEGNTIDLTLTVAKGYIAKIKVRRDNDAYYNNLGDPSKWQYLDASDYTFSHVTTTLDTDGTTPIITDVPLVAAGSTGIDEVQIGYQTGYQLPSVFPDAISGQQHFRFTMVDSGDAIGIPVSDVTVIVEFVRSTDIPQPFDPRNDETVTPSFLEQGFIYGENRGDFAIVEIPTLAMDESDAVKKLFDTDNYSTPADTTTEDPTKDVTFEFYLRSVDKDGNETYTRLDLGVDIELTPYDPDDLRTAGDPYNYYEGNDALWSGPETWKDTTPGAKSYDFVGSKFKLTPTEPDATTKKRTAGAQAVYDMLNNKGSLESYTDGTDTKYRTQLFVMAKDTVGRESAYTQVWIRPWFALGVKVISYAPTHKLEGRLYKLMDEHELNVKNGYWDEDEKVLSGTTLTAPVTPDAGELRHYKWDEQDTADFTDSIAFDGAASGKWLQILTIRSSELLGRYDKDYDPHEDPAATPAKTLLDNVKPGTNLTYALELKKVSNLTYTRIKIDLDPNSAVYTAPGATPLSDYYADGDYTTRTFMLQDTIQLIAGDVDGNGKTKVQDYDGVYDYVYRSKPWSSLDTEPTAPAATVPSTDPAWTTYQQAMDQWKISVYNPLSMAYRCDLDGNGRLTVADLNIVNTRFNYNRDESHYFWYQLTGSATGVGILPFGLGPRDPASFDALFALRSVYEGELFGDLYWDDTVDPATTLAVPMETFFIDEDGNFTYGTEQPETPPSGGKDDPADLHGERLEIPVGEEAMDREAAILPDMSEEVVQLPGEIILEEEGPDTGAVEENISPAEEGQMPDGEDASFSREGPESGEEE